jgi:dienelactone hydrolase
MLEAMRRRTTAAVAATTVVGAAAAAAVAAGRWACGAALYAPSRVPRPAGFGRARLSVLATAAGRVTLTRSPDALRPGAYGLVSPACHAVIGPVLDVPSATGTVVRRLERVNRGELVPGTPVTLTPQLHTGDPRSALGIGHAAVEIPAERGSLPAWFVPGYRDTWVIALHGLGATREHPLNLVPFLHGMRFPVLVPGYRGDPGAPRPRDGMSRLGETEWHDADAALRYAIRYGAQRVVLYGWSTGGAMALYAAAYSPLRGRVGGILLDSPVLAPAVTLRALAAHRGVPAPLLPLAVGAARGGLGLEPGSPPDHPTNQRGAPVPILVVHGPGDTIAPFDTSRDLAARHPESVTLHTVPHAQHAAMWNADPGGYEEALRRFLIPLT